MLTPTFIVLNSERRKFSGNDNMIKHRFCKTCDCNVGVTRVFSTSKNKVFECNNCLGEIVVKTRTSAKKKKFEALIKELLKD